MTHRMNQPGAPEDITGITVSAFSAPDGTVLETEPVITTDIAEYRPIAAALHDLYIRHAGVVHDCTTTKGIEACRAARAEIRTCRTSLEAKRKEIKAPALERSRLIDADARRITEALVAIEGPLDAQIKAAEEAAEARREAKRKAEMERLARLWRIVEGIRAWPLDAVGANTQELRDLIDGRYAMVFLDLPEEIRQDALQAKEEALKKLREMLAARKARDAEEARLAAERDRDLAIERQALADERARQAEEAAAEEKCREALRQHAVREAAEERAELDRQRAEQQRQRIDIERQREDLDRKFADECARIAADQLQEEVPTSASAPSSEEEKPEVTPPSFPPATPESIDLLDTLMAEYLELATTGNVEAIDYAQAESEAIGPSVTAVLAWVLRDCGPGSSPIHVHALGTAARDHLLDQLAKYVAPRWALAQYPKRVEETAAMVGEWP